MLVSSVKMCEVTIIICEVTAQRKLFVCSGG
jgi:hypothetical protein